MPVQKYTPNSIPEIVGRDGSSSELSAHLIIRDVSRLGVNPFFVCCWAKKWKIGIYPIISLAFRSYIFYWWSWMHRQIVIRENGRRFHSISWYCGSVHLNYTMPSTEAPLRVFLQLQVHVFSDYSLLCFLQYRTLCNYNYITRLIIYSIKTSNISQLESFFWALSSVVPSGLYFSKWLDICAALQKYSVLKFSVDIAVIKNGDHFIHQNEVPTTAYSGAPVSSRWYFWFTWKWMRCSANV